MSAWIRNLAKHLLVWMTQGPVLGKTTYRISIKIHQNVTEAVVALPLSSAGHLDKLCFTSPSLPILLNGNNKKNICSPTSQDCCYVKNNFGSPTQMLLLFEDVCREPALKRPQYTVVKWTGRAVSDIHSFAHSFNKGSLSTCCVRDCAYCQGYTKRMDAVKSHGGNLNGSS